MGCPSRLADEELPMQSVTSRDGTTIAFDRLGDGPPVELIRDARRRTLGGQDHNVDPTVLGLVLKEFFTG
jgi:hypothetical protein